MRKLIFLVSIFTIMLSCSSDETSTPVTPPPAPAAKYTITLSAGEGGTVSTTGGEYEAGQIVSVTATPQGEYLFKDWSDGNTDATRTITVSSNSTLTANFEKRKYPLTLNIEGEGEVLEEIVNSGRTTDYESGIRVKLTAIPSQGWGLTKWSGEIESKELSVEIIINKESTVNIDFHKRYVPSFRGLKYDYPNNTTSKAIEQGFKQPRNIKESFILNGLITNKIEKFKISDDQIFSPNDTGIEFDYDNDGNIDYFSFLTASDPYGRWGVEDGLYILITDVFNPNRKFNYFYSNGHSQGFYPELLDINSDGLFEIIACNQNSHSNGDGSQYADQLPPRVHSFNSPDNMNFNDLFSEPRGSHDYAFGDVDNDGDTDILYWEYTLVNGKNITQQLWNEKFYGKPILYTNDGNGNFVEEDRVVSFPGLYDIYINKDSNISDQYVGLYVDLFDFDGDKNLDIIVGNNYGDYDKDTEGLKIFWGNGKGIFDFNNGYTLENKSIIDYSRSKYYVPFGGAYLDIDKDGDLDIIVTGSNDYTEGGWWIQVFEQTSKRVFKDVSIERIGNKGPVTFVQKPFWENGTNIIDPIFLERGWVAPTKDPFVIDIDNDGDYDILPTGPNIFLEYRAADNFYYENIGGIFFERWSYDSE